MLEVCDGLLEAISFLTEPILGGAGELELEAHALERRRLFGHALFERSSFVLGVPKRDGFQWCGPLGSHGS